MRGKEGGRERERPTDLALLHLCCCSQGCCMLQPINLILSNCDNCALHWKTRFHLLTFSPSQDSKTALLGLRAAVALTEGGVKKDKVISYTSQDNVPGHETGDPGADGPAELQQIKALWQQLLSVKGRL